MSHSESALPWEDFFWNYHYHIVKCSGCNEVAFVEQRGDEDTWEYDIDGRRIWHDIFKVYPEEPKEQEDDDRWFEPYKITPKKFKHTPKNICDLYEQIVESYNNQHLILSTSGLRTLIEGICSSLNIKKGYMYDSSASKILSEDGNAKQSDSLGGRIFGLYESRHIVFTQALILQKVKVIGNSAIHDIVVPDIETIKEIISIIETIMEGIFELKNHPLLNESN